MKTKILAFFSFVALFSCYSGEYEQFNQLRTHIVSYLTVVAQDIKNISDSLKDIKHDAFDSYAAISLDAVHYNTDYYNGQRAGASTIYAYVEQMEQQTIYLDSAHDNVLNAISSIQSLNPIVTNANASVDFTAILSAISNNTTHIDLASSLITGTISNHVSAVCVRLDTAVSYLQAILQILRDNDPFPGGGSGSGDDDIDYSDYLEDIIGILSDTLNTVGSISSDLLDFVNWALDVDGEFRKFYSLAISRLQSPDATLFTDLSEMWKQALYNMTNIVYSPDSYSIESQLGNVILGENAVQLSNEGYIQLESLAFNQRQYLCSVEMLNQLRGLNATNNLAWITNYLDSVQRPYYELFQPLSRTSRVNRYYSSAGSSYYASYTNFLGAARSIHDVSSLSFAKDRWELYVKKCSNWWERVEIQLMTLNGLFPFSGDYDLEDFSDSNDHENSERRIEYTTNALNSVVSSYSVASNGLNNVLFAMKEFLGSFDFPQPSGGYFTILPETEAMGMHFDSITLPWSDLSDYTEPINQTFTFIWWTIFALISFRLILLTCFLLGKAISHLVLIISTLMS